MNMWAFCLNSLLRQYGWEFFTRVALRHPLRTAKVVIAASALDLSADMLTVPPDGAVSIVENRRMIVGVGFCLKPIDPPCPSGRPNHDCHYLEDLVASPDSGIPEPCRQCAIREIGAMALKAGAAFYIMTSARDILMDVFMPALDHGEFSAGLFALCRYSMRPFAVGLSASKVEGWLLPFEEGDCQDYRTWLLADKGIKEERTELSAPTRGRISELLLAPSGDTSPAKRFERRGNVLHVRSGSMSDDHR